LSIVASLGKVGASAVPEGVTVAFLRSDSGRSAIPPYQSVKLIAMNAEPASALLPAPE
jgi:hypothetical protein